LSRCIQSYLTKHDQSPLKQAIPRTWDLEISYADELDEMWSDELWDLGHELNDPQKWWILKPGMADRGMGIRLFNNKAALQRIFEEFEGNSDDEDTESNPTTVMTSQLRHFVIQVRAHKTAI
jgi:tubulin---tyrosine ligase